MTFVRRLGRLVNRGLRRFGYQIVGTAKDHDPEDPGRGSRGGIASLPGGAEAYLRPDNARLRELERLYGAMDARVTTPSMWTQHHVNAYDLRYFRGDNAYLWQVRESASALRHTLAAYYAAATDALRLLDRLEEDDLFGVHTFQVGNRKVSRDLLDSILEIHFLERHLGISKHAGLRILDIGAGYGRLAHRVAKGFPSVERYYCTDAIPISTFICEYYLRFRGVNDRAVVLPLHTVEETLAVSRIDLAINIHSFSECTVPAIGWWLALLQRHGVKHLMIVPNPMTHGGELFLTKDGEDFLPLIERNGYGMVAKEPKYRDPAVQGHGIQSTYYYLFTAR